MLQYNQRNRSCSCTSPVFNWFWFKFARLSKVYWKCTLKFYESINFSKERVTPGSTQ